jgi:asparagine synthetase B (glutamine-hydrolysing)
VALAGNIWNEAALKRRVNAPLPARNAELVRALYESQGDEFPDLIDGTFGLVLVDRRRNRFIAARDHCGIAPLFYAVRPEAILVASNLATLVAMGLPATLNPDFITNTELLGYSSPDACFLDGAKQVPPGAILTAPLTPPQSIRVASYRTPPVEGAPCRGEAVDLDGLSDALGRAVEDALPRGSHRETGLLLSGGVDSTLLAQVAAADRADRRIVTVSLGNPQSPDVPSAASVALELGLKHVIVPITLSDFEATLDNSVTAMCGYPAPELPVAFRLLAEALPAIDIMGCGEGADTLFAGCPWHVTPRRFVEAVHDRVEKHGGKTWLIDDTLNWTTAAVQSDDATLLRRLLDHDQASRLVDLYLSPVELASTSAGIELRYPFLRRPIWDWARSTRATELVGRVGKAPLRDLLARTNLRCAPAILERQKRGLPDGLSHLITERYLWAQTVMVDAAVEQLCDAMASGNSFSKAWWTTSLRAFEAVASSRRGPRMVQAR